MTNRKLSTEPYKGVRDFYPEEMAIQRYIFSVWSQTAESFGFSRYDASILEPAELYKSKGAENAEMVDEQTYTFIDRGEREVTLRPEMTPTVARMVAKRRRQLSYPLRWYSIPNLFRYERPQRGRLREHWQLNCDIFGSDAEIADAEIITLVHQIFLDFGATPDMFAIHINDRQEMQQLYADLGIVDTDIITAITRLNDRKQKITAAEYRGSLLNLLHDESLVTQVTTLIEDENHTNSLLTTLQELGITNVKIDRTIARGFDYYTGTIFEVLDTHPDNNRSLLGGGRYDELTQLFDGEAIPSVGFGMGDVTMRDFLESHDLLPTDITHTAPTLMVIPTEPDQYLSAQKIAATFRSHDMRVAVDYNTRKLGKRIADAGERGVYGVIIVGPDEVAAEKFTLKILPEKTEKMGSIKSLVEYVITG